MPKKRVSRPEKRKPHLGRMRLSIVVQVPFMSLSFVSGAIVQRLEVDVAWIPGLIVPGVVYGLIESGRRITAAL
jgi:hypothetical protein